MAGAKHPHPEQAHIRIEALLKRMGPLPVSEMCRRLDLSPEHTRNTLKQHVELFEKDQTSRFNWKLKE